MRATSAFTGTWETRCATVRSIRLLSARVVLIRRGFADVLICVDSRDHRPTPTTAAVAVDAVAVVVVVERSSVDAYSCTAPSLEVAPTTLAKFQRTVNCRLLLVPIEICFLSTVHDWFSQLHFSVSPLHPYQKSLS